MQNQPPPLQIHSTFQSRLERIATGMNYFALSVPKKITLALGTRKSVPVFARVNDSEKFLASLYPVGGGRHYLRVKHQVCKAAQIKAGDRVRVQVTVRDQSTEISIPKDLMTALRAEGALASFKALPLGKKSYILRLIDEAARPKTRDKRIRDAVVVAKQKKS